MGKAGSNFKKPAVQKKMSKKELKGTLLIIAAIVAAVVVIWLLIANDDFIRVKNGVLQMEDNWLISDFTKTGSNSQYYKIGEVGEIEGFTLGEESAHGIMKYIWPEGDVEDIYAIYVVTGGEYTSAATELAINTALESGSYMLYSPKEITCAGRDAMFVYCLGDPAAIEEQNAEMAALDAEINGEGTETADENIDENADENVDENADETADETAEEVTEEAVEGEENPGCIIYSVIKYDDERSIVIQINTVDVVSEEEALEMVDMVGEAITITER